MAGSFQSLKELQDCLVFFRFVLLAELEAEEGAPERTLHIFGVLEESVGERLLELVCQGVFRLRALGFVSLLAGRHLVEQRSDLEHDIKCWLD